MISLSRKKTILKDGILQTWNLLKNLHDQICAAKFLHTKNAQIATISAHYWQGLISI